MLGPVTDASLTSVLGWLRSRYGPLLKAKHTETLLLQGWGLGGSKLFLDNAGG